eukprot:scpid70005/ scgid8824/ 
MGRALTGDDHREGWLGAWRQCSSYICTYMSIIKGRHTCQRRPLLLQQYGLTCLGNPNARIHQSVGDQIEVESQSGTRKLQQATLHILRCSTGSERMTAHR